MSVSAPARRPRSSTAATRSRPTSPPRASSRRSHRPPTLRAFGAPAGCILAGRCPHPLFSRPHPPPTRPRKATSGRARRDFPRGRSVRWPWRLIEECRRCWFAPRGEHCQVPRCRDPPRWPYEVLVVLVVQASRLHVRPGRPHHGASPSQTSDHCLSGRSPLRVEPDGTGVSPTGWMGGVPKSLSCRQQLPADLPEPDLDSVRLAVPPHDDRVAVGEELTGLAVG